jgi:hypothetical protein
LQADETALRAETRRTVGRRNMLRRSVLGIVFAISDVARAVAVDHHQDDVQQDE